VTAEVRAFGHAFIWNLALSIADIYPREGYFTGNSWDISPLSNTPCSSSMRHVSFQKENYRLNSITAFSSDHGWALTVGFECVFQSNDDPSKFVTHLTENRSRFPIFSSFGEMRL
jgi:hypothetical protein